MKELKEGEGEGKDEKEDDPVKKLSFDCQISDLPKLYGMFLSLNFITIIA